MRKVRMSKLGMTCCLSNDERHELEVSKKIDARLAASYKRLMTRQNIVLIGAAESGKTTFLKQMQLIHGSGFSYEEKIMYRTYIYENILRGMAGLVNGKRQLKLAWRGSFIQNNNTNSREIEHHMHELVKSFVVVYKQYIGERYSDMVRRQAKQPVHIMPSEFQKLVPMLVEIWNDDSIRETFERRRELPEYFVENVPYFIENIGRISRFDYMPDSSDILRCRRATTGIVEVEMEIKNVPFRFIDMGGQRTQRQKWFQCLSDVTAILFMASSSEYDECLREDHVTNRLEESAKVFETLINYRLLKNVEFIVFFNKYDVLKEKIKHVDISDYFEDFVGNSKCLDDVESFLIHKFTRTKQEYQGSYLVQTKQKLDGTKVTEEDSGDYDKINLLKSKAILSKSSTSICDCDKNSAREIYSHFTTAIDTNNIRTIFEMIRLMIFEKNCKAVLLN